VLFPVFLSDALVYRSRPDQARAREGEMVETMRRFAGVILLVVAGAAFAAEEGPRLLPAPSNRLDVESVQRGARDFVNYCLNCHSAQYMRYNRLADLGLTEKQIQDNLMFASDKIGSTMTV